MGEDLKPHELLAIDEVCAFFGGADHPLDPSTLYRGIAAGRYPRPIKVAAVAVRWLLPELIAARQAMIEARDKSSGGKASV
jgi:predicted DNA-binding transcriptional regulator AlpA